MQNKKPVTILIYTILCIVTVIMIYPFLWMFFASFKTNSEIIQNPLSLLPAEWTLDGYKAIQNLGGYSIWHYLKNSIIISLGTTVLVVLSQR